MFNKEKKQIAMQMLQNTLTQIVSLEAKRELYVLEAIENENNEIKNKPIDNEQIQSLEDQATALKQVLESYEDPIPKHIIEEEKELNRKYGE